MTESIQGKLVTASGRHIADIWVIEMDGIFGGTIDLAHTPDELLSIFREYEVVVNGQMLALLDGVEREIERMKICVELGGSAGRPVCDLQIYPSMLRLSFRSCAGGAPASDRDVCNQLD